MSRYAPQRGGCLTIFLVGVLLANGLAALSGAGQPLLLTLAIARIVFALAIWSWQRWGAYGYGVVTVFLTAAYLLIGDYSTAFVAMLDLTILAYLLRESWPQMK